MKFIKNFRVFENLRGVKKSLLESEIDLKELEGLLIDFKQMGLEYDIKTGSSIVVDWNLFNDDKTGGSKCLHSSDIHKYTGSKTGNSLTIEFTTKPPIDVAPFLVNTLAYSYNINDTAEAYEMLKDYLFDNYDLIPNYIYVNYHWSYMYFEDFDKIKEHKSLFSGDTKIIGSKDYNIFKSHKLTFGFYKDRQWVI